MTYLGNAPFGPMVQGRGVRLNVQVRRRADGGDPQGWDISSDDLQVRLRAWEPGSTTLAVDEPMTKSTTGAAEGYVDHWHACGAAARETLRWEIVVVDTSVPAAGTVSGKQETRVLAWSQPVLPAATQPPPAT